ncbi:SGNH hydrolase-type esterase domain-containing protein [Ochromonadaceae sp. CCMP2298]|nr:SGNH hydrolase-type esterase domain-containing protein [Ochromonadaceae sp. CCMP2298]
MWVTISYSRGHHPYSLQLQKRFTEAGVTAAVLEKGIDGEQARRMLMRLPTQLSLLADVKYVVILGGTNDLPRAKDRTGAAILRHVVRLHQIVQHEARSRRTQIYTVAVGVPEIRGWGNGLEEERQALNRGLQDYAAHCGESVVYVDWEAAFSQKEEGNLPLWSSDLVHFSERGYDRIGDIMYDTMKAFVEAKGEAGGGAGGGEICTYKGPG